MTHRTKIVHLGGFYLGDDPNQIRRITEISIMQKEFHTRLMSVPVEMIDPTSIETRGPTDDSMDLTWKLDDEKERKGRKERGEIPLLLV